MSTIQTIKFLVSHLRAAMSNEDNPPEQRSELAAELRARARATNNDQARRALTTAADLTADSNKSYREALVGIHDLSKELRDEDDAELMAAHWALRGTASTLGAADLRDTRSRGEKISRLELAVLLAMAAEAREDEERYQSLVEK